MLACPRLGPMGAACMQHAPSVAASLVCRVLSALDACH
jgi:hypothetical protein